MELHSSGLISTLVMSLVAAFAGGLAMRAVRLPPLLGYHLAGIMLGPFTPGFTVDQTVAAELAKIGVALLLFNIGIHFSFKELVAVRKIALFGAIIQMLVSCSLGTLVAWHFFGCRPAAALMVGLSFSIASTAVSTRLLEERRQMSTFTGQIAMGWLVVQDIAVILAMVLFPIFVKTDNLAFAPLAATLGQTLLQIAGFAAVILFGVRKLIPGLLIYVARIGSRELFTLAVIVVALGIAYGSSELFGVSLALGAFFAGVVIGETDLNHHAAADALSMQQVFTILFFVSAGMLFDPRSLLDMPAGIMASWAIVVFGIGFVTFLFLLAMRLPIESAALVGGAFAQIGEFSFVLSQLGYQWGILSDSDRDLILAVAFISMVLNPFVLFFFVKTGRLIGGTNLVMRWRKDGETHIPSSLQRLDGHVILIGHGRVGQMVSEALRSHNIPYMVIESDRRLMEKLRKLDVPVVFGDAARERILMAAHSEGARLAVVTIPQKTYVRRIVALIKQINPSLEIIVRVHEETEAQNMVRLGIGLAVMGEREIALGLSAFALQHYGIESHVVLETLSQMRQHTAEQRA
jgi:CPA2 family monovalent cation:H+ antiporter-2